MPGIPDDCELKETLLIFGHELLQELDPSVLDHDSVLNSEQILRAEFSIVPGREPESFFNTYSTGFPDVEKSRLMVVKDRHIRIA